jgi:hypothetical protein
VGHAARRWTIAAGVIAWAVAIGRPAAAEVVGPCRAGTPEHAAARETLDALDRDIRRTAPGADPQPLNQRLEVLGRQRCFRILSGLDATAKSGLALRTWWNDGGRGSSAVWT